MTQTLREHFEAVDAEEDEVGRIMLELVEHAPQPQRRFTMLACAAGVNSIVGLQPKEIQRRLKILATQTWPEIDFSDSCENLVLTDGAGRARIAQHFTKVYPVECTNLHRYLAEYQLGRIGIIRRELRSHLAATRSESAWQAATANMLSFSISNRLNRFRFRNDATVMYEQKYWYIKVMHACYVAGYDPAMAVQLFARLFANPIGQQYDQNQDRNDLMWLAQCFASQSYLLRDYPEDIAFYRTFRERMVRDRKD